MSIGHMTKQEQVITIGGMIGTPLLALTLRIPFGEIGLAVGVLSGVLLTFIGKAWAWQYTSYERGLNNPEFTREQ